MASIGVGDDGLSYGFCGNSSGDVTSVLGGGKDGPRAFGEKWKIGDVFGVALNVEVPTQSLISSLLPSLLYYPLF